MLRTDPRELYLHLIVLLYFDIKKLELIMIHTEVRQEYYFCIENDCWRPGPLFTNMV